MIFLRASININMICSECGAIFFFADDSSYTFSSNTAEDIIEKISDKLKLVSDFMPASALTKQWQDPPYASNVEQVKNSKPRLWNTTKHRR